MEIGTIEEIGVEVELIEVELSFLVKFSVFKIFKIFVDFLERSAAKIFVDSSCFSVGAFAFNFCNGSGLVLEVELEVEGVGVEELI